MARYRIKKFLDEFIIIFHTVLLFFVAPVMALESPTHKAINEHVANKNLTFNGFSLHNHLQIQLGMPEGVETYFAIDNTHLLQLLKNSFAILGRWVPWKSSWHHRLLIDNMDCVMPTPGLSAAEPRRPPGKSCRRFRGIRCG